MHSSLSGYAPVFSHEQPWSWHVWHPFPPSGLSHAQLRPWLCGSNTGKLHVSCACVDLERMFWMAYMFDQSALVLECVTLAQVVELVIEVLVDFAGGTVFDEETAEDP